MGCASPVGSAGREVFGRAPIHETTDVNSYEYESAARREQYFGELRWDLARPLLQERLR